MNERKSRIAEYIESIEGNELSSAVLFGGEDKKKKKEYTKNGRCTNGTIEGCEYSKNNSNCKNAVGTCEHSWNGANCLNGYVPGSEGENTCSCCKK